MSSIEHGESLGEDSRLLPPPINAEDSHIDTKAPIKTYSSFSGYAIAVNYIIGTGVFGLPFAFYSSGLGLGIICLTCAAIFSLMCLSWVLETAARAEGVTAAKEKNAHDPPRPVHQITFRKFDFTALFQTFLGTKGKIICQIAIVFYCYGVLWAFAAVFSSSVSNLFYKFVFNEVCDIYTDPTVGCAWTYRISLTIYGVIVVILSCLEVAEQAKIQVAMTIYRFIAFSLMLITVVVAYFYPNPHQWDPSRSPIVNFSGFAVIFTSGAVALNFHYNLPDIIKPVEKKIHLLKVTGAAQFTAYSLYVILGCLCAAYFRADTEPLVTLNWQSYTGRLGGWGGSVEDKQKWAIVIQLVIMLFPVFDMLSVYSLVAITLGNNIFETLPMKLKIRFEHRIRVVKVICQLVSSIPGLILAGAFGKLDKIFTFCGLFGFFLELIFPCVLHIVSRRQCITQWGPGSEKTPYSVFVTHPAFAVITLVVGSLGLSFAAVVFVAQLAGSHLFS